MTLAADTPGPRRYLPRLPVRYVLMLVIATAIVHLVATFIATSDNRNSAYHRMAQLIPLNEMKVLPPIRPGYQPLPYLSPESRYAMCQFSALRGPVSVQAVLPDRGWSIGIYNPDGSTAFFATGAIDHATDITLTILAGADRVLGITPPNLGAAANPQITVNASKGLIVLRAPDRGHAYRRLDEAMLARAACSQRNY